MVDPYHCAELRRLSLNITAAHICMVVFLEEASAPWSADQILEFERISAFQDAALDEYTAFLEGRWKGLATPRPHLWLASSRRGWRA